MVTVTFDRGQFLELLRSPQGPVWNDIFRRGKAVENRAKRLVPVNNGRLKQSITTEMSIENGAPVAKVGTNVEYALFVHEGTGIYGPRRIPIRPVRAKALRFKPKGSKEFIYRKRSAGSPPKRFLTDALPAAYTVPRQR